MHIQISIFLTDTRTRLLNIHKHRQQKLESIRNTKNSSLLTQGTIIIIWVAYCLAQKTWLTKIWRYFRQRSLTNEIENLSPQNYFSWKKKNDKLKIYVLKNKNKPQQEVSGNSGVEKYIWRGVKFQYLYFIKKKKMVINILIYKRLFLRCKFLLNLI